jgi:hypothetical protein
MCEAACFSRGRLRVCAEHAGKSPFGVSHSLRSLRQRSGCFGPRSRAGGCTEARAAIPVGVSDSRTGTAEGRVLSLAEGEDVRLYTRVEECDLERAVRDRPGLAHQLIEPWLDQRSPALLVDVQPVGGAS